MLDCSSNSANSLFNVINCHYSDHISFGRRESLNLYPMILFCLLFCHFDINNVSISPGPNSARHHSVLDPMSNSKAMHKFYRECINFVQLLSGVSKLSGPVSVRSPRWALKYHWDIKTLCQFYVLGIVLF